MFNTWIVNDENIIGRILQRFLLQNIHYIWWHPCCSLISRVLSILRTLFGPCKFLHCLFLLPTTITSWIVTRLSLLRFEQNHISSHDRHLWTILYTHPYCCSLSSSPSPSLTPSFSPFLPSLSPFALLLSLSLPLFLYLHLFDFIRLITVCSLEH